MKILFSYEQLEFWRGIMPGIDMEAMKITNQFRLVKKPAFDRVAEEGLRLTNAPTLNAISAHSALLRKTYKGSSSKVVCELK